MHACNGDKYIQFLRAERAAIGRVVHNMSFAIISCAITKARVQGYVRIDRLTLYGDLARDLVDSFDCCGFVERYGVFGKDALSTGIATGSEHGIFECGCNLRVKSVQRMKHVFAYELVDDLLCCCICLQYGVAPLLYDDFIQRVCSSVVELGRFILDCDERPLFATRHVGSGCSGDEECQSSSAGRPSVC